MTDREKMTNNSDSDLFENGHLFCMSEEVSRSLNVIPERGENAGTRLESKSK